MKRKVCRVSVLLFLLGILLGGCGDTDLLEEIPRDFVLTESVKSEMPEQSVPTETGESGEDSVSYCFLEDSAFEYAAQGLSGQELLWYEEIRDILASFGENATLDETGIEAGLDERDIDRIFQYVLSDHPELFYVEGYSYTKYTKGDETVSFDFMGTYSVDAETAEARRKEIGAEAERILGNIGGDWDDYAKAKAVYETVILETDYDRNAPENQNIYSVFVNHRSVCQGYAKATQFLLNRLGVECTLVTGTVETGETHAWNLVRVDGAYYYLDTTWGDASYSLDDDTTMAANRPQINYDYLNVTTQELLRTHTPSDSMELPLCVDTDANYYVREGAFFSGFDKDQLRTVFEQAKEQGRDEVALKCSDEECYRQMLDRLIGGQEIFLYMDTVSGGTVAYTQNDSQMSLSFWVTNE